MKRILLLAVVVLTGCGKKYHWEDHLEPKTEYNAYLKTNFTTIESEYADSKGEQIGSVATYFPRDMGGDYDTFAYCAWYDKSTREEGFRSRSWHFITNRHDVGKRWVEKNCPLEKP